MTQKQKIKCRYADQYKAMRPPKCGCLTCENKWAAKQAKLIAKLTGQNDIWESVKRAMNWKTWANKRRKK